MHYKTDEKIKDAASKMIASWDPSYLFVVTPAGFFIDSSRTIVDRDGKIEPLGIDHVSMELQERYTKLLNTFIE